MASQRNAKKRVVPQEAQQSKLSTGKLYTETKFARIHKNLGPDKNCISKSFYSWSFGSINIRSGKEKDKGGKLYMIAKEAARAKVQFCTLQEVRYRNSGR